MKQRNRKTMIWLVLVLLVISAAVFSICVGAVWYSPIQLLTGPKDSTAVRIFRYSRLPRTIGSLLAGMALATSGAVIQNVLANPLAAPNIIGVNSGAGFMVATSMAFLPPVMWVVPASAFLGALLGVMIILWISDKAGASKITLVLAGVAVSGLFSGATDTVLTFVPDALKGYTDFRIGGLKGVTLLKIGPATVCIVLGFCLILLMHHELDILGLGSETAQSLGLKVRRSRILLLTGAALLAGSAVSFAGIIGFVGLIVPHIMRKLIGGEALPLLLGSALGGAFLVTVCDTLARSLLSPYELPVGIVLSFLGAPFFLWLLLKQKKRVR